MNRIALSQLGEVAVLVRVGSTPGLRRHRRFGQLPEVKQKQKERVDKRRLPLEGEVSEVLRSPRDRDPNDRSVPDTRIGTHPSNAASRVGPEFRNESARTSPARSKGRRSGPRDAVRPEFRNRAPWAPQISDK